MSRFNRTPRLPDDLVEAEKLFNEGKLEQLKKFATQNLNVLHLLALNKQYDIIKAIADVYISQAPQLDVTIFERLYFNDTPQRDIIKAVAPNHPEVAFKIFARLVFPNQYPQKYFESVSKTPNADPDMEEFLRPYVLDRLPSLIQYCGGAVLGAVPHHQDWDDEWDAIEKMDLQSIHKVLALCPYAPQSYNFELGLQKAILYADCASVDALFAVSTHGFLTQSLEEWVNNIGHVRWDTDFFSAPQDVKDTWMYVQSLRQKSTIVQSIEKNAPPTRKSKL